MRFKFWNSHIDGINRPDETAYHQLKFLGGYTIMKFEMEIPIEDSKMGDLAGIVLHINNGLNGLGKFSYFGGGNWALLIDKPIGPVITLLRQTRNTCISCIKSEIGITFDGSAAHELVCKIYDDMKLVTLECAIRERTGEYRRQGGDPKQAAKASRIALELLSDEENDLEAQN